MESILRRLEESTEAARTQFSESASRLADRQGLDGWESWFSPYEDRVYRDVLAYIRPEDVVMDIGAGDLRLGLRLAAQAQTVYAVEVNPLVVAHALHVIGLDLPRNLHVICGNALRVPVPSDVSVGVLLMRHCQHFQEVVRRLQDVGCRRLLTNARWRTGVEKIDLDTPGVAFEGIQEGWYACRCGGTGYVGAGERPDATPAEVSSCPACSGTRNPRRTDFDVTGGGL